MRGDGRSLGPEIEVNPLADELEGVGLNGSDRLQPIGARHHCLQRPCLKALAVAIGHDFRGWRSIGLHFVSIPLGFVSPWISVALYIAVALIWFMPDRRIESTATT
jgi:hypothetical protein